jgi:hypothetical protein
MILEEKQTNNRFCYFQIKNNDQKNFKSKIINNSAAYVDLIPPFGYLAV